MTDYTDDMDLPPGIMNWKQYLSLPVGERGLRGRGRWMMLGNGRGGEVGMQRQHDGQDGDAVRMFLGRGVSERGRGDGVGVGVLRGCVGRGDSVAGFRRWGGRSNVERGRVDDVTILRGRGGRICNAGGLRRRGGRRCVGDRHDLKALACVSLICLKKTEFIFVV